jgi:competence protein ComFC
VDWTYHLTRWLWDGLNWLFPPVCVSCGQSGFYWCPDCQKKVVHIKKPVCDICGLPQRKAGLCNQCAATQQPYCALRSWAVYDGVVRDALLGIKYRRNMALGLALAIPMAKFVNDFNWPIDGIVPISLGRKRTLERGYNQVGLVGREMATLNHWSFYPNALTRIRETKSQVGLSFADRIKNVDGAFRADACQITGKTILLLDDVTTTGSTIKAGVNALILAGASSVYVVTIARALPHGIGQV